MKKFLLILLTSAITITTLAMLNYKKIKPRKYITIKKRRID